MPLFLNKTQTLSFLHIVCVYLVLYSWLFDYKFALICSGVILMFNLIIIIIIIVIKKKKTVQPMGPTQSMWAIGLDKFVNLKTWIQPKNFITQPNLLTTGRVGSGWFCLVYYTPLIEDIIKTCNWMLRFLKWIKFSYKIGCRLQPYSIKIIK